jgi:hypothetical protein
MPISDQRDIRFDADGVRLVLATLPESAARIGLPAAEAEQIAFDQDGQRIRLTYPPGTELDPVALRAETLGAMLIAFCIRHRLPVPRQSARQVEVREGAVVLRFITDVTPPARGGLLDPASRRA